MNPIPCPDCGDLLHASDPPLVSGTATSFETCRRQCERCGIGISNGAVPTFIYRDPLANIPVEVREGALETLSASLNVGNRGSKLKKFGFSTSEDTVTWTVFTFLHRSGHLDEVMRSLGILSEAPADRPALLLWGVPVQPASDGAVMFRQQLRSALEGIGERSSHFSEPDVALDCGAQGLILIEVKYRSGNTFDEPSKFARYCDGFEGFTDANAIKRSGLYELARNWRIGCDVAGDRPMKLINLVSRSSGKEAGRLEDFTSGLDVSRGRFFRQISWSEMLGRIQSPPWLDRYLGARFGKDLRHRPYVNPI